MKITYTYYQKTVRYYKSGAPVQVRAKGQTYEGITRPIRWCQFLVDEMANYIDLQASIDETKAILLDSQVYAKKAEAVLDKAEAVLDKDMAEGRAPKEMRTRDRKERIAEIAKPELDKTKDDYKHWKTGMLKNLEGYERDFEAAGITLADMRGDYVAPAFWCYDTMTPEQKAAITAELSELYTGVKINDLDAVAALEAGLNGVWQRYDLAQHDIAITIKWQRPSDPELLAKMEAAAAKRRHTRALNKQREVPTTGIASARMLAAALTAKPVLTGEAAVLAVALSLMCKDTPDVVGITDYKELADKSDERMTVPLSWFEERAIELFRRGKYWRSWQDPEALTQRVRAAMEELGKVHTLQIPDKMGKMHSFEGPFLHWLNVKVDNVPYVDIIPSRLFFYLRHSYFDTIDYLALLAGYQKDGDEYVRLRLAIGAWQPMISHGNTIELDGDKVLPGYSEKKEGESASAYKSRRHYTRKKAQKAADTINAEGGANITITTDKTGGMKVDITPSKKPGKDDGKEPETEQV